MASRPVAGLAILLAACAGFLISLYLTGAHYSSTALACANSGPVNCDLVTRSSFGLVPGTGLPVSAAGLLWFGVAAVLGLLAWLTAAPGVAIALIVWSLGGLAAVLYLVYAELVRLHHVCEWCTASHLLAIVILLLSVGLGQRLIGARPNG